MPIVDLTDEELAAVISALKDRLDREWRFRMSPRLEPFVSALAKLDPSAPRTAAPPRAPLPRAGPTLGPRARR